MLPDPPKTWGNLYYPPADYVYFAQAKKYPFATGNVYVKAAWAADAAMLAYGRRGPDVIAPFDFAEILIGAGFDHHELIGDWCNGAEGTQGYFAYNDSFAILSFRGTERGDPKDAWTDARAVPVDEPDFLTAGDEHQPALRHLSLIEELFGKDPCRVHEGFQAALNCVWPDVHHWITSYRQAHPASEICFTGHSLGAALATLAVSRFAGGNASLYTIGCPRVGNAAFCARVCAQADKGVFRFVNCLDPVTHVPVDGRCFQHPAPEGYYIDAQSGVQQLPDAPVGDWLDLAEAVEGLPHAGLFTQLDAPAPAVLVDHSPGQYCVRMWNFAVGG